MAERAAEGWITVTELADTLARDHGVSFKAGHTIASRLIAVAPGKQGSLAGLLREISAEVLGRPVEIDDAALAAILSPQHFVEVRTTPGGPAPSRIAEAIEQSTAALARDRGWLSDRGRLRRGGCTGSSVSGARYAPILAQYWQESSRAARRAASSGRNPGNTPADPRRRRLAAPLKQQRAQQLPVPSACQSIAARRQP